MSIYDKSSLVLIPSGTKTGKVFSQKPVSGDGDFTFTRASAATRVNADGNIEKETSNLLLQSNSFSTGSWSRGSSTITTGQSGYDGTNDATLLSATGGFSRIFQDITSFNGVFTASAYVKAGTGSWINFRIQGSNNNQIYFDIANGVLGSVFAVDLIDTSIVNVGNGWYRVAVTLNMPSVSQYNIYIADANGSLSTTNENIYIQDFQVNQGLVAQPYQETTTAAVYGGITDNTPRLDYTDSSCPALLLEPLRTNVLPHSEYFKAWNNPSYITSNAAISPEGIQNASYLQFASAFQSISIGSSLPTGVTCTASVYVKGTAGESVRIAAGGADSSNITLTGDWQRIEHTATSVNSSFNFNTFGGATARNFYVWGAQLEQASYATSYIPTYGSSVSRVAETCSKTSATDLIGQNEGSFYAEIDFTDTDTDQMYMTLSDGTSNNRIHIGYDYTSDFIYCNIRVAGSAQGLITTPTSPSDGIKKIAVAYAQDDYVMYINGTQVGSDANANVPTLNRIDIGNYWATGYEYPVKQNLLFKTRLTNAELADLTTL